jgi:hypothetical protein
VLFTHFFANVDLDIQGYLTLAFHKAPEISPALEFTATFTPVSESSMVLLVLPALALIWANRHR